MSFAQCLWTLVLVNFLLMCLVTALPQKYDLHSETTDTLGKASSGISKATDLNTGQVGPSAKTFMSPSSARSSRNGRLILTIPAMNNLSTMFFNYLGRLGDWNLSFGSPLLAILGSLGAING